MKKVILISFLGLATSLSFASTQETVSVSGEGESLYYVGYFDRVFTWDPWLTVTNHLRAISPSSGEAYGHLTMLVAPNNSVYPRSGSFILYGEFSSGNRSINVEQGGYPVSVTASETNLTALNGEVTFNVDTSDGVYWQAYIESFDTGDESDWATLSVEDGYGRAVVTLTVKSNILGRHRELTVNVASKTYSISQKGGVEYDGEWANPEGKIRFCGQGKDGEEQLIRIDDKLLLSSLSVSDYVWLPQQLGSHKIERKAGNEFSTMFVNCQVLI